MTDAMTAGISTEIIETDEPAFDPTAQDIGFTLEPVQEEEKLVPTEGPVIAFELGRSGYYTEEKPAAIECMYNLETTGLKPFESRIISIAAADYMTGTNVKIFQDENEEKMVTDFINWYRSRGFTKQVIYNAGFDFRFIMAKCMKFGINAPEFLGAEILDLMQVMLKGRVDYLRTLQKSGTLHEWTTYFFGPQDRMSAAEILTAFEAGDYDVINNYNKNQVLRVYMLLSLMRYIGVPDA